MRTRLYPALPTALLVSAYALAASATVEPPAVSDARSAALGGTGVAYSDNGAAVFHNPAGLGSVGDGVLTLSLSPFLPQLSGPIAGTVEDSKRSFFPMFLAGGAYRLSDKLVAGLAVYPVFGFGAEYEGIDALGGQTLSMSAAAFEASPAIAYSITDDVTVAVGYRATYMIQQAKQVDVAADAAGNPLLVSSEANLSGMNFLGAQVGLLVRVAEGTSLGFTYRNKTTVDLDGDTKVAGQSMDTSAEFATPHTFKVGVAQSLLDERLMLALDLKYALYSESSETQAMTVEGVGTREVPLEWEDSISVSTGLEYRLAQTGPDLRVGYSVTTSATSQDYPQPFLAPPGLIHSVHAGTGMRFSDVAVDLGGYYMFSKENVEPAADAPGEPGEYGMNVYVVAVSASYGF